jgi:hypothetical protein
MSMRGRAVAPKTGAFVDLSGESWKKINFFNALEKGCFVCETVPPCAALTGAKAGQVIRGEKERKNG